MQLATYMANHGLTAIPEDERSQRAARVLEEHLKAHAEDFEGRCARCGGFAVLLQQAIEAEAQVAP